MGDQFNDWEGQDDDEDNVRCNRCGTTGLYWQDHWLADGSSKPRLMEGKKPHVCPIKDNFDVVEDA